MDVIFGLVWASVFPLIVLGIIRRSDFYQTGQFKLILASLGFGIFAYVLASITDLTLEYYKIANWDQIVRFFAPIHEEIFKGLFLLILVKRRKFNYSVDGALYGFSTGIGFAIAENIDYIARDPSEAMIIASQRIFSANLVHASSSAILGIALWMFYLRRTHRRWLFLMAGLFLAIDLHLFYNNIVSSGKASLGSAFAVGILGAVFVYLIMRQGKVQAQVWIRQKLGSLDGVTPGEVAMVNRLPTMDNLLYPVFERFGPEKARQVEKLLYLQARLAIKCNFLDNISKSDPSRDVLEKEIHAMRTEMQTARRKIGAYAMLFVRGLYTPELISVWEKMEAKILAQSAQKGGQKGGGLWSSLEERLKAPADMERRK